MAPQTAREHALITRQELKDIIQALEKHSMACRIIAGSWLTQSRSQCFIRFVKSALHTCRQPLVTYKTYNKQLLTHDPVPDVLSAAQESINTVIEDVSKLSQAASKLPYYKFNNMWARQMQGAVRY